MHRSQRLSAGDEADAYLTDDQAALLNEMLDTHLNYFLASGPITSHGLPLTAYKPGDPAAYIHSTPAEWGYALQAWIVAWERGKLTEGEAVNRIDTALTTIRMLQNDPAKSHQGLFYWFYWLLYETGTERPFPVRDPNNAGDSLHRQCHSLPVVGHR